ncbi:MAG: hypothetical protein V5A52_07345, partial [Halovenus sp.]
VFATHLQALGQYPGYEPSLEHRYVLSYFTISAVPGIRTPLSSVVRIPPGTVHTFDRHGNQVDEWTYWTPTYTPRSGSTEAFADRITQTIADVLDDHLQEFDSPGLLISGGLDSRLLLGATPKQMHAYHLNDWENKEALLARRIAEVADTEFTFLRRDESYHDTLLQDYGHLNEFASHLNHPQIGGFIERLREETDVLVNGLYADTFLEAGTLPTTDLGLPIVRTLLRNTRAAAPIYGPYERKLDSIDEFVQSFDSPPEFVEGGETFESVLREEIESENGRVASFGVEYDSLDTLVAAEGYYPFTRRFTFLTYTSMNHMWPTVTPFLDNRIIDLHLQIPRDQKLRGNLIGRALKNVDRELARIPSANSGLPALWPHAIHYSPAKFLGQGYYILKSRFDHDGDIPDYYGVGSWQNRPELIRETSFVRVRLEQQESIVRNCPFLDWTRIQDVLDRHMNGENHATELYRLLSFLYMPAVQDAYQ